MPTTDPAANRRYCQNHYQKLRGDPEKWAARLANQRLRRRASAPAKNGKVSIQGLSAGQLELFEERAAIMEFDGGLSREDAELAALQEVINSLANPA